MERQIIYLIGLKSKGWLANKLDITRPTLDSRLKHQNWKKLEEKALIELIEKYNGQ